MPVYKNFVVLNFAYGTGPYLRTTELAIAVNDVLQERGKKRLGIIVPFVYGEKQKKIMCEEFADLYKKYPGEVIFDKQLGSLLKKIFYANETYEHYLARWVSCADEISHKINTYLKKTYSNKILLELHRSSRVLYNIAPSYFVSFAYIGKIYERLNFSKEIIHKIKAIEENHHMHFITEPGTFSYMREQSEVFAGEISIPPTISMSRDIKNRARKKGVFVTVTGISGLERLYGEAKKLGLQVYSNDVKAVPFAKKASPHAIASPDIIFQFARSGWSSVWLSMLSDTPIVVPEWDKNDDPEIYFNNICIEKLGLGIVYRGQSLKEILKKTEELRSGIKKYKKRLLKRFGTLDGTRYAAERIVHDIVK